MQAHNYLILSQFDVIGNLLREGWELKVRLEDNVWNSYITEMIENILSKGALGAKITCAGGGVFC